MLSDPTRIRIILALEGGELSVNELANEVGKAAAAVPQHLAKLRWARIVQARHVGARMLYSLIDEHPGELVHQAWQAEHARHLSPQHHRPAAPASPAAQRVVTR